MKKNYRIAAGILAMILCILLGCGKKENGREDLLLLAVEDTKESSDGVAAEGENGFLEETGALEETPKELTEKDCQGMDAAEKEEAVTAKEPPLCVVHICGAVSRPGVYTMEEGSRIYQAIEEAGGFREDASQDYLNQADLLSDGMKIYVPTEAEVEESDGAEGWLNYAREESGVQEQNTSLTKSGLVNINTAGEDELCTLPGVGSSKARSIIAYREKNGAYHKIEDIMNVEGIKDGVFLKIKDSITV